MRQVSLTYNENNPVAQKTMDFVLSSGLFEISENASVASNVTLKTLQDSLENKDVVLCSSFEDYLKAVE